MERNAMDQAHGEILRRLEDLTLRVGRLEKAVNLLPKTAAVGGAVIQPGLPSGPIPGTPGASLSGSPLEAQTSTAPPAPAAPLAPPTKPRTLGALAERHASVREAVAAQLRDHSAAGGEEASAFDIEKMIGGRWFAAIGAIVVVIGVGLFVKLAYDWGWFGGLGPAARCAIGAGFGALLVAVGELARRKVNAWASMGLYAAGIGAMYASAYTAYALYQLVDPTVAFVMLAGIAALGVLVAAAAGLASVAAVSLLGGYLAPVLVASADPPPHTLPAYLLVLQAGALVLSGWKSVTHPSFRVLRSLSWWGTGALGFIWTLAVGREHPWIAIPFFAAAWTLVHAEQLVAARRMFWWTDADDDSPERRAELYEAGGPDRDFLHLPIFRVLPLLGSLSTTIWSVGLTLLVMDRNAIEPLWAAPAAWGVATLMLSFVLAGHLRFIRDMPRTAPERLGAVLVLQCGGLIVCTVALALDGWPRTAAWLALGVASIGAGRWVRARALDFYGMVQLTLASVLLIVARPFVMTAGAGWEYYGVVGDEWSVRLMLAALAWTAGAALMPLNDPVRRPWRATLAAAAGLGLLLVAFSHPRADWVSVSVAWGLCAAAWGLAARVLPRVRMGGVALAGLMLALCAWVINAGLDEWTRGHEGLFAKREFWVALGLCAAAIGVWRWSKSTMLSPEARAPIHWMVRVVVGAVLFGVTSLEVARSAAVLTADPTVRLAAVSIYWGLLGVGLLMTGFARGMAWVRYAGLALLGVATVKALLVDMAEVAPVWRVASFLGLGLLMMGVAVGYARVAKKSGMSEEARDGKALP